MRDLKQHSRLSAPLFRIFLLAILTASLAAVPFRLAAQEATPAVKAEPAGQTAKPEAGPSEEEQQSNAFRLDGPVVKWTAKTLNAPASIVARVYEVINFLIIVFAIGIPLYKFLPKFLKNRAEKVRNDIEAARKVTEDANARLSAVEAKLSSLGEEIAKFRAEVEHESVDDEARIKAAMEEESVRIVQAAEQEIGSAAAQARRGLRHFAADLAIEQASKQLNFTPETDHALLAEFVAGMGKGGQN